jgi:hypothetical protein
MTDLGIIIVSYNTAGLTLDCLASVFAALPQEGLRAAVWVLDNDSADGSADRVAASFSQVHLVRSERNLGFAGGNNRVLDEIARSGEPPRHVLLLNSDTIVPPGALRTLVAFLDGHPQAAVAGASLTYGDGSFQHAAFRFPTLTMAALDFYPANHRILDSGLNGRYPRRRYRAGRPFAIDHPLGAAMMVRWAALAEVGPLDPGYFMYCEEIDWCLRFRAAGWDIYCVPKAQIVHLGGQSARQFRDSMFVALWRSRYRLFERHYGALYRCVVRRIVRGGLRRQLCLLERQVVQGATDPQDAERRRQAYCAVIEL